MSTAKNNSQNGGTQENNPTGKTGFLVNKHCETGIRIQMEGTSSEPLCQALCLKWGFLILPSAFDSEIRDIRE